MMANIELYIVRHGLAGEHGTYANDNERPLTEDGKKKTRQVAKRLRDLALHFHLILTSPLVRAKQTADILMDAGLADKLDAEDFLAPDGKIEDWITWLQSWQHPETPCLAIVGHEPNLSTWTELLLWGEAKGSIELKKAGVIGLSLPDEGSPIGKSTLFWLTPPRFLLT
jgi:phosphohistidine phosphatase